MRPRLRGGPVVLAATLLVAGCSTTDSPFPSSGSLFVNLRATGLGLQSSSEARLQYIRWEVARLDGYVNEPSVPSPFRFVTSLPCFVAATPVSDGDVRRCGGSGLTLEAVATRTVTFQLQVARLDGIGAARPDLPDAGDYDGDGVPNGTDNCKIVWNPLEDDGTGSLAQPKTCYLEDTTGAPTISDQDRDAVPDALDNCLWFPNGGATGQSDANANGIGDSCEQTLPASLPAGGVALECPGTFTVEEGTLSLFIIDFTPALTCDLPGGSCSLELPATGQPTEITVRRNNQLSTDAVPCTRIDPL